MKDDIIIRVALYQDIKYADCIVEEMQASAQARGTGIAKRSPEYITKKITEEKAVIALTDTGLWVGFCYIEAWGHDQFVANSGLIVSPQFRKTGIAKKIKERIFELSKEKYPAAKIFGLTTGLAVMKINSDLGYTPVTYSELTNDDKFWAGCKSCVNYDILMSKERKNCLCTAMLYDPAKHAEAGKTGSEFKRHSKLYERFLRLKQGKLIKAFSNNNKNAQKKKSILLSILGL